MSDYSCSRISIFAFLGPITDFYTFLCGPNIPELVDIWLGELPIMCLLLGSGFTRCGVWALTFCLLALVPDCCRDFAFIDIFCSVSLVTLLFTFMSVAGFCLLNAIGGISTDSWLALIPFIAWMPFPLTAGICLGRLSIDWDRWRLWWVNC